MNIYDIAEKCGVSIATVSRVLNNNPNVSAATRERILAVINEANYTPSALARRLGTGDDSGEAVAAPLSAVGVLCTNLTDPRNAAVVAAVEAHLRAKGKSVLQAVWRPSSTWTRRRAPKRTIPSFPPPLPPPFWWWTAV